ncbi:MAG: protein-glutamate O-methyltransferase CheR [Deltaproteobacteria bacterium]|nr:protein-glutamate O-methyltransferase CheR [Deltaproteobacteria bacterium]
MIDQEKKFGLILSKLRKTYGFDFSQYRMGTIRRRLARRMAFTGADSYRDYLDILEERPQEYGHLLNNLTIKVSRFFRNQYVFERLQKEILPDLFRQKKEGAKHVLRIWCAGCAFGEEVYSVAITLVEYLKKKKKIGNYDITIFGTDIDEETLEKARLGIYDEDAVREVKKGILDEYFHVKGDHYQVVDSIKSLVSFTIHDLTSERYICPPAGVIANYDLILCRNTLIYFSVPLQEKVFSNLSRSLNRGGYLILGRSESIPKDLENFFDLKNRKKRIFQKKWNQNDSSFLTS